MGLRYIIYRIRHEFEKKIGSLKKRHPEDLAFKHTISLEEWKKNKNNFLLEGKEQLKIPKEQSIVLKNTAERILKGDLLFFNAVWMSLGIDYKWNLNPSNGYAFDLTKHWSEIPDLSEEAGDIKFVWEKSRFSYLLILIRYDYHFDKDLSEFVFSEIESWIDSNPINKGPNWRCSQEISLRILNWCFALYYYQNSKAFTEQRWNKIQKIIYASVHHVYHHIDFSRIAVRNNHAITETLFLTVSNILFPFIPETNKWARDGKNWFEQEIQYQIYDDGTFLQFSMNYHRVVVQLLSLAFSLYNKNNQQFSPHVYDKAYKSLNFLYQCMQDENGYLPNYGSNDGSLFFPVSNSEYRDYRPQLNTLHFILTTQHLFQEASIQSEVAWYGGGENPSSPYERLSKIQGVMCFDSGGYYLCRHRDFFTFIRCGDHKDRPAQADNLHLDIWYKGENILRDSGTYKYNTDSEKLLYFMGSASHNTVMVNNQSQMLKGGRFIWYYWTQKISALWEETDEAFIFKGRIKAFQFLNKKATHQRTMVISKNRTEWLVKDDLTHLKGYEMKQIWHPSSPQIKIQSLGKECLAFTSYNSSYYGSFTEEAGLYFPFYNAIETKITFQAL
ncbi:heparinase [Elizabethkingia argentiflava]|uniref:Heparinase n=1 Tax=Elizabethkingia argenteiflava TaxID=2681556 RepID=A0A845PU64_9FLAO|nr:alginate lyase family protein [Elizabethkingia argenteiflava]NAW51364.1 heparinase [Elizabethkingia argenteiflava]